MRGLVALTPGHTLDLGVKMGRYLCCDIPRLCKGFRRRLQVGVGGQCLLFQPVEFGVAKGDSPVRAGSNLIRVAITDYALPLPVGG